MSSWRKKRSSSGFTLIELVVAIVIIAILAAIALPQFFNMGQQSRLTTLNSTYAAVQAAANMAFDKCLVTAGCYTPTSDAGPRLPMGPGGLVGVMHWGYPTGTSRVPSYFGISDWMTIGGGILLTQLNNSQAEFSVAGAPDPTNCMVVYVEAANYGVVPTISMLQSGC